MYITVQEPLAQQQGFTVLPLIEALTFLCRSGAMADGFQILHGDTQGLEDTADFLSMLAKLAATCEHSRADTSGSPVRFRTPFPIGSRTRWSFPRPVNLVSFYIHCHAPSPLRDLLPLRLPRLNRYLLPLLNLLSPDIELCDHPVPLLRAGNGGGSSGSTVRLVIGYLRRQSARSSRRDGRNRGLLGKPGASGTILIFLHLSPSHVAYLLTD